MENLIISISGLCYNKVKEEKNNLKKENIEIRRTDMHVRYLTNGIVKLLKNKNNIEIYKEKEKNLSITLLNKLTIVLPQELKDKILHIYFIKLYKKRPFFITNNIVLQINNYYYDKYITNFFYDTFNDIRVIKPYIFIETKLIIKNINEYLESMKDFTVKKHYDNNYKITIIKKENYNTIIVKDCETEETIKVIDNTCFYNSCFYSIVFPTARNHIFSINYLNEEIKNILQETKITPTSIIV